MRNDVKTRKKRFWAVLLTAVLLLNLFPPLRGKAAAYSMSSLYGEIFAVGDTLTNDLEKSCTVTYYDASGTAMTPTETIAAGQTYTAPAYTGTVPEGRVFVGWYGSMDDSGDVIQLRMEAAAAIDGTKLQDGLFDTSLIEGTVIYSESDVYTITYYDQDGTTMLGDSVTLAADTPYTVATYPKTPDAGYEFTGWKVTAVSATGGSGILELTAQVEEIQYTVRFVNDDGTVLQSDTLTYGAQPVYSGETPVKAATAQYTYTFTGWDAAIVPVTDNATYTAVYSSTVNQYTVTFQDEDGTELQSGLLDYGAQPSYTGETPTKAGTLEYSYPFTGWNPELAPVTGDAIYTAVYTQTGNPFTITFDTSGGTAIAPITQAYGSAVTPPGNPEREGYSFASWNPEIPATMPAENLTILARWTVNAYTITFDTSGGSEIAPITQDYGTAVTAPANPTRTGYAFTGWNQAVPATMPGENLTLTAQWTGNSYGISYNLDGGTNGSNPGSYQYGTGVSALADAVKPGYTFAGWYDNSAFSGTKITAIPADRMGDVALYAKFELGTIEAGTHALTAGVLYKLGNVTKVSGDSSVYVPGSTFYVSASGNYTFS